MATDSFTTGSDTVLSTYDANWALANGYTNTATVYAATGTVGNTLAFRNVAYYRSDSSSGDCQMVKKALPATVTPVRTSVAVRMNGSRLGYTLRLDGYSDPNATTFVVTKNGTTIGSGNLGASVNTTSDFTLRIQALANGADQEIRVWVNGTQQTFTSSSGGASYSGLVLTDPSANTPYTDGSPGFVNTSSAALADTYWDDFDDLEVGASAAMPLTNRLITMNGGMIDLT